jgi:general secretion pathway protein D
MVKTIKRLDIYPREVLIEAIIAEVSLSDSEQYGIQWSVLSDISAGNDVTGLGQQTFSNAPNLISTAPGLVGSGSSGLSYVVFKPERLVAMLHALTTESRVNILSSPRLLVRDQEEASIEVGSDVPTATSTTSSTTTDTLTQSIEYRTVGIKLKIKPTISEERTVVLDLEQEVSSQGENVTVGAVGTTFPSFNTTKTKTSIVVPDKQGIIIGGIMEEETRKGHEGIPFLSSIPILGNLFRYTVERTAKTELVIIITPHVVASQTDTDLLTKQFMRKLKNIKKLLKDNEDSLTVPDLDEKVSAKTDEP